MQRGILLLLFILLLLLLLLVLILGVFLKDLSSSCLFLGFSKLLISTTSFSTVFRSFVSFSNMFCLISNMFCLIFLATAMRGDAVGNSGSVVGNFWDVAVDNGLSSVDIGNPKDEETKITTRFIVTNIFG